MTSSSQIKFLTTDKKYFTQFINKPKFYGGSMDEKWGIDFKKLKKSSSKKLKKGGLGFFLSPREETKTNGRSELRKSGNWGDENFNGVQPQVEVGAQDKDFIDDIPVIPSLDDFADDLSNDIAKAPLVDVEQVTSYKDLETALLKHSAFASLEEVNLQVLIKLLHPESCLDEPDTPWTKDGLFNEIISIFNEKKSLMRSDYLLL